MASSKKSAQKKPAVKSRHTSHVRASKKSVGKLLMRHKLAVTGGNVLVAMAVFTAVFAPDAKQSSVMQAQAQTINEINLDDPTNGDGSTDEQSVNQGDLLTDQNASVTPGAGTGSVNSDGLAQLEEIETLNTTEKLELDSTGIGSSDDESTARIGDSAGLTTYGAMVSDLDMKEKLVLAYAVMSFIFFTGATVYFVIRQELWFLPHKHRT